MVKNVKLHKSTMGRFQTIYTARFHLHPLQLLLLLSLHHLHHHLRIQMKKNWLDFDRFFLLFSAVCF